MADWDFGTCSRPARQVVSGYLEKSTTAVSQGSGLLAALLVGVNTLPYYAPILQADPSTILPARLLPNVCLFGIESLFHVVSNRARNISPPSESLASLPLLAHLRSATWLELFIILAYRGDQFLPLSLAGTLQIVASWSATFHLN